MEYSKLIEALYAERDEEFATFTSKSINSQRQKIIGVRTPVLRAFVKNYKGEVDKLLNFPDDYYEVSFIKLNVVASLPYDTFLTYLPTCVACIENWALCDTFKPKCIQKHKEAFLPYIQKYLSGNEFETRFALVTLLNFYVEEKYLPVIFNGLRRANLTPYYACMGGAWLLAEVLIKQFDEGIRFLEEGGLDKKTHNKAIQKARESFRLTQERKDFLRGLKRK